MPESAGDARRRQRPRRDSRLPTLVIGRKLFETDSDIELAFVVGRTLAAIRPDHVLRWPSFVSDAGRAGDRRCAPRSGLVDPERTIPPDITAEVEQYAGFLTRTLPPQVLEQMSVLVKRFAAAHGGDAGAVGRGAAALGARAPA